MKLATIPIIFLLILASVNAATIPMRFTLDFQNTNGIINANNVCYFQPTNASVVQINSSSTLINASETAATGLTYANQYETMNNGYFRSGFNTTKELTLPSGRTGLLVPKFSSSTACAISDLSTCPGISSPDFSNYCQVTDEFSQIGVSLANSRNGATTIDRFNKWYNTVLEMNNSIAQNVTIASWRQNVKAGVFNKSVNTDSATDATVRIGSALLSASVNPTFNSTDQSKFLALGLTYCREHVQYEYSNVNVISRVTGANVTKFVAGGKNVAATGPTGTDFMYSGYFGDVMLFLDSCYWKTGNTTYRALLNNVSEQYLLSTNISGTITGSTQFRVSPGVSFKYQNVSAGGTPYAECTNTCSPVQWDSSDAPRAVTMCQALYYLNRSSGASAVNSQLAAYCNIWVNSSGWVAPNAYAYYGYANGTRIPAVQGGYYENGLGSYLNFWTNQTNAKTKIDEAITHYSNSGQTFDSTSCQGAYRSSFLINSFGRAIGYDDADHNITTTLVTVSTPASNTTFCTAAGIGSSSNPVTITGSAPTAGQVLTAVTNTTASWQNVSTTSIPAQTWTIINSSNLSASNVNTTLSGINQSYKFVQVCLDLAKGATVKNSSIAIRVNGLTSGYKWNAVSFSTLANPSSQPAWNITASGTGTQSVVGCAVLNTVQHNSNGINDVYISGTLDNSDQSIFWGGRTSNLPGTNLSNITIGDFNGNDVNITGYIRLMGMS